MEELGIFEDKKTDRLFADWLGDFRRGSQKYADDKKCTLEVANEVQVGSILFGVVADLNETINRVEKLETHLNRFVENIKTLQEKAQTK